MAKMFYRGLRSTNAKNQRKQKTTHKYTQIRTNTLKIRPKYAQIHTHTQNPHKILANYAHKIRTKYAPNAHNIRTKYAQNTHKYAQNRDKSIHNMYFLRIFAHFCKKAVKTLCFS